MTMTSTPSEQTTTGGPTVPEEQVLSTLNLDGTRRWLRPKPSPGRFLTRRRAVAYGLIGLFVALPWISINGRPAILLDIPAREFTFFGATFLPTDSLLLMLLLASVFVTIFLVTALLGRIWCGWACPQTVYMEFLFRPIERFFDGPPGRRAKRPPSAARTAAKYGVYLLCSLLLAHVFLAYFVGVDRLFLWMQQSPLEHPTSFLVMLLVTGAMMFDFSFFREQVCILMCPYGRFQSVMLDRSSLIISYDEQRGEPRGRRGGRAAKGDVALPQLGDCVDCRLCVTTCPTGIDIRDGLQLECIGCAQCIDACDTVMTRIGKPRGLIRYSSQEAMETGRRHLLRPRVIIYPAILTVLLVLFTSTLAGRMPADITLLRSQQTTWSREADGTIRNDLRVKIVNRADAAQTWTIGLDGLAGARLVGTTDDLVVEPGGTLTQPISVIAPPETFERGRADVTVVVRDAAGAVDVRQTWPLLGPWSAGTSATTDEDPKESAP